MSRWRFLPAAEYYLYKIRKSSNWLEGMIWSHDIHKVMGKIKSRKNKAKLTLESLKSIYNGDVEIPESPEDLKGVYCAYILTFNNRAIVIGSGKKKRSKIIFDDVYNVSKEHIKSVFVRLYLLYGQGEFKRYIVRCESRDEAKQVETQLHDKYGGKTTDIPKEIEKLMWEKVGDSKEAVLFIKLALLSSYSALSDLNKWKKNNLIPDETWQIIQDVLGLHMVGIKGDRTA